MFSLLKNKDLLKIDIGQLIFNSIQYMASAITVAYVIGIGGGVFEVNLITTIQSSIGVFFLVPFGMLSDRIGRKPMLLIPVSIQLIGFLGFSLAANTNQLIIVSFSLGSGPLNLYQSLYQ